MLKKVKFSIKFFLYILFFGVIVWICLGIYKVQEGEEAVVTRFGAYNRISYPGLNYHIPWPFEKVVVKQVNKSRRIEVGYRSIESEVQKKMDYIKSVPEESIMLTGDENIVELNVDIMWHIYSLKDYLFSVHDPDNTIKAVSESAIREIIGNMPISSVLSNAKQVISKRIEFLIQTTLNNYNLGVLVEQVQLLKAEPPKEVIHAYRDVQTAKADKEKEINQAQAYSNDIIPKARGLAFKILQEAEAYKVNVITKAKGDIFRFDAIYREFLFNKDIVLSKLSIETYEKVLQNCPKTFVDGESIKNRLLFNVIH